MFYAVLVLGLVATLARAQGDVADVGQVLNEIFNSGNLEGMKVSGHVSMQTGNDLKLDLVTSIANNGFGLETEFSLEDGRCDFREVHLGAKASVTFPSGISSILKRLKLGDGSVTVAEIKRSVSFLPPASDPSKPVEIKFDLTQLTDPTTKLLLDYVGADADFTVRNAKFMVSGVSFQLFLRASVLSPEGAEVCKNPVSKALLQEVMKTACTEAGGIEIPNINLGSYLREWLKTAGQNVDYIDPTDGTITIGTKSLLCSLKPAKFSIKGIPDSLKGITDCLKDQATCSGAARDALINAVNDNLPDGYKIDASQFSNLTVSYDPKTGDVSIAGEVYAGAGKDPAALISALKSFAEKNGGFDFGGASVKVSDSDRDIDDGGAKERCEIDPDRVAAEACNPSKPPPPSRIAGVPVSPSPSADAGPGSASGSSADMARDNDARAGDNTMLIIGVVLCTLAVVAAIAGTVVAIKMFRKRRRAVQADSSFRRFRAEHPSGQSLRGGVASPADAFDSISASDAPVVWGDVVQDDQVK